jgi:hypothetical protein
MAACMDFIDRKIIEMSAGGINSHSTCNTYLSVGSKFKKGHTRVKYDTLRLHFLILDTIVLK